MNSITNTAGISFEKLFAKLIRRRWLFITPVCVVMSLVIAYTNLVDLYRANAIALFKTEYALADMKKGLGGAADEKAQALSASLRFGEPLRRIVSKTWPDLDPEKDSVKFNSYAQSLGSPGGIQLSFRRDDYRALSISYTSSDPNLAYRVVKATVDTLVEENSDDLDRRVTKSAAFLKKEINKAKEDLRKVESKILRAKSGLTPASTDMSSAAKNNQYEDTNGDSTPSLAPAVADYNVALEQALKYQETLPELQFNLKIATKEYERLRERLENKEYLKDSGGIENMLNLDNDSILVEVRGTLLAKKKMRHSLAAQGYLEAHPKRRALESEIKSLERLEKDRRNELTREAGSKKYEIARLQFEQKIRAELAAKKQLIDKLTDKIKVLESYKDEIKSQKGKYIDNLDLISAQTTNLQELESEKLHALEAYKVAAAELELVKRRARAEEDDVGLRVTVVEPPKVPLHPLPFAHLSTVFMGLVLSIAAGLCLVCAVDVLDGSVRTTAELQALVPVSVLGAVDRMTSEVEMRRSKQVNLIMFAVLVIFAIFSEFILKTFYL